MRCVDRVVCCWFLHVVYFTPQSRRMYVSLSKLFQQTYSNINFKVGDFVTYLSCIGIFIVV